MSSGRRLGRGRKKAQEKLYSNTIGYVNLPPVSGGVTPAIPLSSEYGRNTRPCATPSQIAASHGLALARTTWNNGRRSKEQDMGSVKNLTADRFGMLAEMIAASAVEQAGYIPHDFVPFSTSPGPLHDFRIIMPFGDFLYNVKAIPPGNHFLAINEAKRLDYEKAGILILPVRFLSETQGELLVPITAQEIGRWKLMQGHSAYRSIHVANLTPLRCLHDLAGLP